MPKRTDIKSILILGAGPIIIGQACEFDYSGTQACKAIKEEGYKTILVNSNPATIMTDPEISDRTYIEPIHWKIVKKIIEKEKPDALLPTMGGQTALNCTLQLHKKNILSEHKVEVIGANIESIKKAENRKLFEKSIKKIGLNTARCGIAKNMNSAYSILEKIGFPCIIRPSFTMGGSGGGIAYSKKEFETICRSGLQTSPSQELLIDESLIGWKEYEMEAVRDKKDNCIIVCSIENFDSMGIHTGDSITVAPAQTLTDKEYQKMRNASIKILKEIGVESGGSNVQFAINPKNGKMIVIEMNPRVSRSSALASKATGFPIAKIAAKLSIGYTLDEIKNDLTEINMPAAFEPSIDYIATKIPRFNFEKFPGCNDRLTTQMKSVGEVMAIGRSFQESIQKAIRGLEIDHFGFDSIIDPSVPNFLKIIEYELKNPGSKRIWYIADAFRYGMSVQEVAILTNIDKWFLIQIYELIEIEKKIKTIKLKNINFNFFKHIKKKGFSDRRISTLLNTTESKIRKKRNEINLHPVYKRIDSCSAEFTSQTAYMYSTWEEECESHPDIHQKKIIILGSGPNRIGQGIEFDYCCVHAAQALQEEGYQAIMINCNPETVSTDYDTSNRLYFEPITLEDILEITRIEKPKGIIIQYGGQTPLQLANCLKKEGINIIGTQPESIDKAEDRNKFQSIVTKLNLKQPKNKTVKTMEEGLLQSKFIKFPIMARPSYVLGGKNMKIIFNKKELQKYFFNIKKIYKKDIPVLLDQYLENAIEIDVDAICDSNNVLIGGIMEHIEQAGIHSGDSACSLPTYTLNNEKKQEIREQVKKLALELNIIGLINIQFAIKNKNIYILEVNPRASRTIPFLSKATGLPLAKIALKVMCGVSLKKQKYTKEIKPSFYSVKEVTLPFNKFSGVNPFLGPEMRSTGEVMGIGMSFSEAFSKAILAAEFNMKKKGKVLISVQNSDKKNIINIAIKLINHGFELDATEGTSIFLKKHGILSRQVKKIQETSPNIKNYLKNREYSYIINTASMKTEKNNSKIIFFEAIKQKIHYDSTINGALATIMSLNKSPTKSVISIQELHKTIKK
ncbi:MAG: carbamoyl-phosphate synthase large subunit [Buchnera aphidicola (Tetraneura sorini)]